MNIRTIGMLQKPKDLLVSPRSAFQYIKDEPAGKAFSHFILLAVLSSLGVGTSALISGIPVPLAWYVAGTFIAIFLLYLIYGLTLQVCLYLTSRRWDISSALRVVVYSSTPLLLFGWVPLVFESFGVYFLYTGYYSLMLWYLIIVLFDILLLSLAMRIQIEGLRCLAGISRGRAILVVLATLGTNLLALVLSNRIYIPAIFLNSHLYFVFAPAPPLL